MADEIKGLVTDLKLLVDGLDEVARASEENRLLVNKFLSGGSGDAALAKVTRAGYIEASTQSPETQAFTLAQVNEDLEKQVKLLNLIIEAQERLNNSRTAPATATTAPSQVVTLGNTTGHPALSMNQAQSVAVLSSASKEMLTYKHTDTEDALGYLHDQVKNVVVAAIADGVGSVPVSSVAASIMKDAALSVPHDQPFTRETILKQAEQVTPQVYAQRALKCIQTLRLIVKASVLTISAFVSFTMI